MDWRDTVTCIIMMDSHKFNTVSNTFLIIMVQLMTYLPNYYYDCIALYTSWVHEAVYMYQGVLDYDSCLLCWSSDFVTVIECWLDEACCIHNWYNTSCQLTTGAHWPGKQVQRVQHYLPVNDGCSLAQKTRRALTWTNRGLITVIWGNNITIITS